MNNNKAYAEVYEIINLLDEKYSKKIPKKVLDFFYEAREKEYRPVIDVNKPLKEQHLQRDTIILLAILDLNYWCDSEEEKKELLAKFNKNTEKKIQKQKELEEKYNPEKLFKNRTSKEENNKIIEETAMVKYKEKNFLEKIIMKISSFFKRR